MCDSKLLFALAGTIVLRQQNKSLLLLKVAVNLMLLLLWSSAKAELHRSRNMVVDSELAT